MAKIFLVEDDRTMLNLLNILLGMEGHQVVLNTSQGELDDVLEQIRRQQPEVLVVDVNLRTFSGLDLVRALRENPNCPGVRVLMSSGMDVHDKCFAAGADDFILKPYMPDTLLQKIKQLSSR